MSEQPKNTDWNRYELLVLSRLDSLDRNYREIHAALETHTREFSKYKLVTRSELDSLINKNKLTYVGYTLAGAVIAGVAMALKLFFF